MARNTETCTAPVIPEDFSAVRSPLLASPLDSRPRGDRRKAQAGPHLGGHVRLHGRAADPCSFHGTGLRRWSASWRRGQAKRSRDLRRPGTASTGCAGGLVPDPVAGGRAACRRLRDCEGLRWPRTKAPRADAVLIVDDGSGEQEIRAAPLRKACPSFCDKPLAARRPSRPRRWADLVAKDRGTPLMSRSAASSRSTSSRWPRSVPSLGGEIHLATTICGNELVYYGIALEMAHAVSAARGVVLNVEETAQHRPRAIPEWPRPGVDGHERSGCGRATRSTSTGAGGWRSLTLNLDDLYWYLIDKFLDLVRTGEGERADRGGSEVIAVLEAGKRSLEENAKSPWPGAVQ